MLQRNVWVKELREYFIKWMYIYIYFNVTILYWFCHTSQRKWWHPTPVLLPGKSHGQRSLIGCSSWGREELDTTERLHFHFSLSCIGEGNDNQLQYSCLENPMDGGAWWAAVHGVAESRTRLRDFTFTFHFPALEKEMATHSSVVAWRIPGTGEPGGLPSMGLHRVGHDWSDLAGKHREHYAKSARQKQDKYWMVSLIRGIFFLF